MPQPGCQPCFFGDSSEQSNHNPIVLAFVIKHEATGTCRLLCGGMGRKPICVRGEAVAALGGGGGAQPWQHRTQPPPQQGHFPGSAAQPHSQHAPQRRGCPRQGVMGNAARPWGAPQPWGGMHRVLPVSCRYPGKEKQPPKLSPDHPTASLGHPTQAFPALLPKSIL